MIDRSQTDWYRDAIIYEVHIKSFFDSNNDGFGDFKGLTEKLDYIRELGVTAIWILPFYPSPLRDDGYDIMEYTAINPNYGAMEDFRAFVEAAHERGLRVITELVINHTSDQHPWFQAARRAPAGSPERDFYVWSDNDDKFNQTRIIFTDTEVSNWTWDPEANAFFWHRFFSHQPDLNFDNPKVMEAVLDVMRYWLDTGVDGLRLDAIPYLVEREGTNCENLPETHDKVKQIRATLDAEYPDRMLLAEANMWPEDTATYFGDDASGRECHMAYHFPLMPRMYMAVAQEDRHPITDIMRQTPEIPEGAQWSIFLRNHDELTLEMVTDDERDYLWRFYAADKRARINVGIRRRLSPLLEGDRRKVELLHSLLFTMPGTPCLYYGDEIGMGDNIYLGDRDGVRTPMQWSPDRNGGFSKTDPNRLYLPAIQDPIYGYDAVNVEQQQRTPSSLLNWVKRHIGVRNRHAVFGRGELRFLYPGNRKVLAYLRENEEEAILCVANLSRSPQAVELDLAEFAGRVPVEMVGDSAFPPVGDLPYLLTLPAYGFYWFQLSQEAAMPEWHTELPPPPPALPTLVAQHGLKSIVDGRERAAFESQVLPDFIRRQRWFGAKSGGRPRTRLVDTAVLQGGTGEVLLARVFTRGGGSESDYFVPVTGDWRDEVLDAFALARLRKMATVGNLVDATEVPAFALDVVARMRAGDEVSFGEGRLRFAKTAALDAVEIPDEVEVRRVAAEQSNTSLLMSDVFVLKFYRRLEDGVHPEIEMGRYLTENGYENTPALYGTMEQHGPDGTVTALATLQAFVRNQGDGWRYTIDSVKRELDLSDVGEVPLSTYDVYAEAIGRRTGELHALLARPTSDEAFAPVEADKAMVAEIVAEMRGQAYRSFALLERVRERLDDADRAMADEVLSCRDDVSARLEALNDARGLVLTRVHGDYHLGQVLIAQDDVYLLDFEGEPTKSGDERRAKRSPYKDVAGMLRSFDYAAATILDDLSTQRPDDRDLLTELLDAWRIRASRTFLKAYDEATSESRLVADAETAAMATDAFALEKALYEIAYEAENRPDWIGIPLRGVLSILRPKTHADDEMNADDMSDRKDPS